MLRGVNSGSACNGDYGLQKARSVSQTTDALCNKISQLLREVKMPNKEIDRNKGVKTATQTQCQTLDTVLTTVHSQPFVQTGLSGVNHLSMGSHLVSRKDIFYRSYYCISFWRWSLIFCKYLPDKFMLLYLMFWKMSLMLTVLPVKSGSLIREILWVQYIIKIIWRHEKNMCPFLTSKEVWLEKLAWVLRRAG